MAIECKSFHSLVHMSVNGEKFNIKLAEKQLKRQVKGKINKQNFQP